MKKICIPVLNKDAYNNYKNALEKLDAEVVFADEVCNPCDYDGLLLPGGGDVNPNRYNQDIDGSVGIDDKLDELQFDVLDLFVKANKPILGICRGHQLINVYFKGNLIQDIKEKQDHRDPEFKIDKQHKIITTNDSFLSDLYGDNFISNSSHHQAVGLVGEGFIVVGVSEDKVIEAMQHITSPIYTVQFHPERMYIKDGVADGLKIISYFLDKC